MTLGHRKKLLRAIAALPAPGAAQAPSAPSPDAATIPRGERRNLTVLFCDLAGSTSIVRGRDPEDMASLYRAYHDCCETIVRRWEGHLSGVAGDGAIAYFGYPRAHEDDAIRAAHAGLALVEAVGGLDAGAGLRLRARVGVATGLVLADALGGGPADVEFVGATLNLAARLQAEAEPGTVVADEATRRLLGAAFDLAPIGRRRLKGFEGPVEIWRVDRARRGERGRFGARSAGPLAPLAGRDEELATLERHWRQAVSGHGRVTLLCGEAGIGKSRLVHALEERLADSGPFTLSYHCSPYHANSAWHPVIGQLERAARFEEADDAATRIAKLEALLRETGTDVATAAPLFASLLSIDAGDRYPPLDLTPQQIKARIGATLTAMLETLAARGPVLIVVEDAHWIDPSFREQLDTVVDRLRELPALMLVTFRPDHQPSWIGRPHVSLIGMDRLDPAEARLMVRRLAGDGRLGPEVIEAIVARADGVPLFLEELARIAIRAPAGPDPADGATAIPDTLQNLLMARLDSLGAAKAVAQTGAVIGHEFAYPLLVAAADLPEAALRNALARLVEADLVFEIRRGGGVGYCFRHALIRDAAYDSLTRARRRTLHGRIAAALAGAFPALAAAQPEVLAAHYRGAGDWERSVAGWLRAGRRGIERSALVEAARSLSNGLDDLEQLPRDAARDRIELDLLAQLGPTVLVTRGYAADAARETFERLRALSTTLGAEAELFLALRGLWAYRYVAADLDGALELAERLLGLAGTDDARLLEARRALGMTLLYRGEFARAANSLLSGAALYDPARHHDHAYRYGNDPGVVCRAYAAEALCCLGRVDEAHAASAAAIDLAQSLGHPFSRLQALALAAMVTQIIGDAEACLGLVERILPETVTYSFPYWHSVALILRGWARGRLGLDPDAAVEVGRGIEAYRATGSRLALPRWLLLEAETLAAECRPDAALDRLAEAEAQGARNGETYFLAEVHRVRAELAAAAPEGRDAAEAAFRRAIAVATAQGARPWATRASDGLARLLAPEGRGEEARALLDGLA